MNKLYRTRKWLIVPILTIIFSLALSACGPVITAGLPLFEQVQNLAEKVETSGNEVMQVVENQEAQSDISIEVQPSAPAVPSSSEGLDEGDGMAAVAAYQGVLMEIYERVNPSVVNIQVAIDASAMTDGLPFEVPEGEELPQNPYAGGMGSGFVWDQDGHIITNNHVVEGASKISVLFSDGSIVDAELVGADPDSDLAVIKVSVPSDQLVPVTVADSDTVKVGQLAIAIGNPFGLDGTMTVGIVSALNRTLPTGDGMGTSYSIPNIIQTDAPINPGNSGGVLVDTNGNLIGVTAAIESPVRANAGIGFVIPSNIVRKVVPSLIETGSYQHPYLGISAGTLIPEMAKASGLDETTRGVIVGQVMPNSPAEKAGLRGSEQSTTIEGQSVNIGGDVITAIDGNPITEMEDLISYLSTNTSVNQKVTMTILRDGTEQTLEVTLAARQTETATSETQEFQIPPSEQPDQSQPEDQQSQPGQYRPRLGITGMDINPEIANALNLNTDSGILIVEVVDGSPAAEAGLVGGNREVDVNGQPVMAGGDIIISIDGTSVTSVEELRRLLNDYVPNARVTLTILRDGQQQEVEVQLGQ